MDLSGFAYITQDFILSEYELANTDKLVLSSNHIPGYYERLPMEKNTVKEHHLFLLLNNEVTCFQDNIFRVISFYEKQKNIDVNVYPGRLIFKNKYYHCIRFRRSELDLILDLIPILEEKGIKFLLKKKHNKITPYESYVQFKKYIEGEEIAEKFYKSKREKNVYYMQIEEDLEFGLFKEVINYLRNNGTFKTFNASLLYIYNKDYTVTDYLMIYSPHFELERIKEFQEKWEEAIKWGLKS